jgi:hypothetical protein
MVVKLAEYSDFAEHADGIIGLDLLSKSKKFTIDYETRTVSLQLAEAGTTGRSSSPCFVIPLVVQGLQVNLAVDTGLQGIVLYKNRLRKGLPKMRIEGESTNVAMGRFLADSAGKNNEHLSNSLPTCVASYTYVGHEMPSHVV